MRSALTLLSSLGLLVVACADDGKPGAKGEPGNDSLTATFDEPPGENCAEGGQGIESGVDENGNDDLDEEEVLSTTYVCNGVPDDVLVETLVIEPGDPSG
jgi:hypothetical protein